MKIDENTILQSSFGVGERQRSRELSFQKLDKHTALVILLFFFFEQMK